MSGFSFFVFVLVPASKILVAAIFIKTTVIIIVNVIVTRYFIFIFIINVLLVMVIIIVAKVLSKTLTGISKVKIKVIYKVKLF